MEISVIVPTYNGAHKLPGILNAFKKQTFKDFELLVVVDGSTDNTLDILNGYETEFKNFKIIVQKNGGRSKVRNRGAKEAEGDLLIFFDDDMLPEPDCIAVHIKHHKKNTGTILTGAQIDSEGNSDIQKYKTVLSIKWSKPLQQKQGNPLDKESIFITAANFSITKSLFIQLQGFDELLTDAEDFDLAVRAFQQDIPLYYNHSAFAWHNDPITGKSYIKRLREYGNASQRLRELKPALYSQFPLRKPKMPIGIKKKIYLLFTYLIWVKWIDKSILKKLVPKVIRFKLYDLITTANGVYFPDKVPL